MTEQEKNYSFKQDVVKRDLQGTREKLEQLQDEYPHRRHKTALQLVELAEQQLTTEAEQL